MTALGAGRISVVVGVNSPSEFCDSHSAVDPELSAEQYMPGPTHLPASVLVKCAA